MASLTSNKCEASFPSHFKGVEESNIHQLVEPSRKLSLANHTNKENKSSYLRNGDAEIDIFTADKYFSGRMDEDDARKAISVARRRYQDKNAKPVIIEGDIKPRLQPQTPSVHSESSNNSQTALLRRQIRSKSKAPPKKKFFANLGCKCACCDKNSVDIEDHADDLKQNTKGVNIKTGLDPADLIELSSNKVQSLQEQEEERKSIEIFGSSQDNGNCRSLNVERRMNMLGWDAIPKAEEMEIQRQESIKDTESEVSSDLFEIECLSCSANPVVQPRQTTLTVDGGGDSPTNCYAPSEASVEWSVVTASAAEFSVFSDSEEQASFARKMLPPRPRKPTAPISELPKARFAGILSGCKSQKAVRVAGDVHTTLPVRAKRSESFRNVMQFQMDTTKNVGFGSKCKKDLLYIQ